MLTALAEKAVRAAQKKATSVRIARAARHLTQGHGNVLLPGIHVEVRLGAPLGRVVLGDECVIGCSFIFEREAGRISVGSRTFISQGSSLICAAEIEVGSDVLIAWGVTCVDHDAHSVSWKERCQDLAIYRAELLGEPPGKKDWSCVKRAPIRIGDKAWIGFNATILKGVTIGEGAVVAAASVVTKDVPPFTLAAGNPARAIKELGQ
ncbi:MAG TPA: acyltransferase [Armatimonadota bacterium]|jgi:galactoside O-acetyltransferase